MSSTLAHAVQTFSLRIGAQLIVASFALMLLICFPVHVHAATRAELQAQINELLTIVSELQAKLAAQRGVSSTASCGFRWPRDLAIGDRGMDVSRLQEYLRATGDFTYPEITDYFGPATADAVSRFQERYQTSILTPVGLTHSNGYFGLSTRMYIQSLCLEGVPRGAEENENEKNDEVKKEDQSSGVPENSYRKGQSWNLSYSYHTLPNNQQAIPVTWGLMAPQVVMDGSDWYAPTFFPCTFAEPIVYCMNIVRNGQVFSENVRLGQDYMPPGITASAAYQPPLVFLTDNDSLIIAHWAMQADGTGLINLMELPLDQQGLAQFVHRSAFINSTGKNTNYLGGAMDSDGAIYFAGYGTDIDGSEHRLDLIRVAAPYEEGDWGSKQVLASYATESRQPVYPHIVVDKDEHVHIAVAEENSSVCSEAGRDFVAWKRVRFYSGEYGQPFALDGELVPWDVTTSMPDGDPCLHANHRWPTDLLYDRETDQTYAVIRAGEIPIAAVASGRKVQANSSVETDFQLYADGDLINTSLLRPFQSAFGDDDTVFAMTLTRPKNGPFVLFAYSRGPSTADRNESSDIAFVVTEDFHLFTEPMRLETLYGAGSGIRVVQPDKNGSDLPNGSLLFFYTGHSTHPDGPGKQLYYTFQKLVAD